jgi:hypothetical protein
MVVGPIYVKLATIEDFALSLKNKSVIDSDANEYKY